MFDFDKIINRQTTYSIKYCKYVMKERFNNPNAIPLWIADMDFEAPKAIKDAIGKVVENGIFGYSNSKNANRALANWISRRHGWDVDSKWIINTPGVVFGINAAIHAFTNKGDKVLIQEPVYYPFAASIKNNERIVVSNDLVKKGDAFELDLEDFERKVSDPDVKLFIICTPHNPLAKIYTRAELRKMFELCIKHDVYIFADEIHNDVIMPGHNFVSSGVICDNINKKLVVAMAPSKTFNLAGLQWSGIVVPYDETREKFNRVVTNMGYSNHNELSLAGVNAAYTQCEDWLDEMLIYIKSNHDYIKERLENELPGVKVMKFEATYLPTIDFSVYNLSDEELDKKVFEEAGIALDAGHWFGKGGSGLMRINIACPKSILEKAINNLVEVFKEEK